LPIPGTHHKIVNHWDVFLMSTLPGGMYDDKTPTGHSPPIAFEAMVKGLRTRLSTANKLLRSDPSEPFDPTDRSISIAALRHTPISPHSKDGYPDAALLQIIQYANRLRTSPEQVNFINRFVDLPKEHVPLLYAMTIGTLFAPYPSEPTDTLDTCDASNSRHSRRQAARREAKCNTNTGRDSNKPEDCYPNQGELLTILRRFTALPRPALALVIDNQVCSERKSSDWLTNGSM
jgi:hypothetical protein